MTLISSIILDAFREGNIIPLGTSPNANQSTEALRLLNSLFTSVYGGEAGESLQEWPLGNFGRETPGYNLLETEETINHPTINQRLIAVNEAAKMVYLPLWPQDGSRMGIADPFSRLATFPVTLNANGRTIEGAATLLLNINGVFTEWFYRADLGGWVKLTSKIAADEMPFPDDFDNFFTTLLALRINPRYGRSMDEQSALIFKNEKRKFVSRYLQSMPREILDDVSWPFMSTQSYAQQREFSSNQAFNRGSRY